MYSKFRQMLDKKRDMKPSEKHAKMGVLKDLKSSLADSMGDKLDGMKKVSVMSDSPEGLSAGLDKAKMMAGQSQDPSQMMADGGIADMDENSSGTQYGEGEDSPAEEGLESEDMPEMAHQSAHEAAEGMDIDQLKKHIDHLTELHRQMQSKG